MMLLLYKYISNTRIKINLYSPVTMSDDNDTENNGISSNF